MVRHSSQLLQRMSLPLPRLLNLFKFPNYRNLHSLAPRLFPSRSSYHYTYAYLPTAPQNAYDLPSPSRFETTLKPYAMRRSNHPLH
jgi:hypothetical protein